MITAEEMRKVEEEAQKRGVSMLKLMENAGAGVVVALEKHFGPKLHHKYSLIFCGTGNNGGDGFVAARYLAKEHFVFLFLLGKEEDLEGIAGVNYLRVKHNYGIEIIHADKVSVLKQNFERVVDKLHEDHLLLIDAMIGTGVKKNLREPYKTAVELINDSKAFSVSVDVPTGMDPDTGEGKLVVDPNLIVTFHDIKKGLSKLKKKTVVVDILGGE